MNPIILHMIHEQERAAGQAKPKKKCVENVIDRVTCVGRTNWNSQANNVIVAYVYSPLIIVFLSLPRVLCTYLCVLEAKGKEEEKNSIEFSRIRCAWLEHIQTQYIHRAFIFVLVFSLFSFRSIFLHRFFSSLRFVGLLRSHCLLAGFHYSVFRIYSGLCVVHIRLNLSRYLIYSNPIRLVGRIVFLNYGVIIQYTYIYEHELVSLSSVYV